MQPYIALAIQPQTILAKDKGLYSKIIRRCSQIVEFAVEFYSLQAPVKLVALPEFFLQGTVVSPRGKPETFLRTAISIPGEETDQLGEEAKRHHVYVAGESLEVDQQWPDRVFNCGFLIDPRGRVILKYRKIQTLVPAESSVSPHDMLDEYAKKHGSSLKTLFPVADTEIGRIGLLIAYDGLFPEVARALAFNGAEILIRPSAWFEGWTSEPLDWWYVVNKARAIENLCYVIAPARGGVEGASIPRQWDVGHSMIVDCEGRILVQTKEGGENVIGATLNIEELRFKRQKLSFNHLAHLRAEAYRELYNRRCWPPNMWKSMKTREDRKALATRVVKKLQREGVYAKPALSRS